MSGYPAWAIDLVAALEEHEDNHADDKDPHTCVKAILEEIPTDVRSYVAAWKDGYDARKNERASGGLLTTDALHRARQRMLGEPEGFPRAIQETVRFGDHDIRVVEHPSCPPDLLVAIGSCGCGHPVGGHSENGCFTTGRGTGEPCPCITPLSRLITGMKIVPDGADS